MKAASYVLVFFLFIPLLNACDYMAYQYLFRQEIIQLIIEHNRKMEIFKKKKKEEEGKIWNLAEAIRKGNLKEMIKLLDEGVPVDATYGFGYSIIGTAVENNQIEALRELVKRNADVNSLANHRSYRVFDTLLLDRIYHQYPDMVYELLQLGADIKEKDHLGQSAIMLAGGVSKYVGEHNIKILLVLRKWVIEQQIEIIDPYEITLLDNGDQGSFVRDFAAYTKKQENKYNE